MINQKPACANGSLRESGLSPVGLAAGSGGLSVVASRSIESGSVILEIRGEVVDRASKYSLQVDDATHIEYPWVDQMDASETRHQWRYLNHSCDPNAVLIGLQLVAIKPIAQGEEITFDYNTTEYEMSTPFRCECGHCGGALIRGFKFLSSDQQWRLEPRLAEHLRRRLPSTSLGPRVDGH